MRGNRHTGESGFSVIDSVINAVMNKKVINVVKRMKEEIRTELDQTIRRKGTKENKEERYNRKCKKHTEECRQKREWNISWKM